MRSRRRDTDVLLAFAANVRARRNSVGMSQEALGDEAGLHRTYVSNVESGKVDLSLANALRIAQALDTGLDGLVQTRE